MLGFFFLITKNLGAYTFKTNEIICIRASILGNLSIRKRADCMRTEKSVWEGVNLDLLYISLSRTNKIHSNRKPCADKITNILPSPVCSYISVQHTSQLALKRRPFAPKNV